MSTDIQHVRELFEQAIALPEGERASFLDEVCAGDAALRADVQSLLEQEALIGDAFLRPPRSDPEVRRRPDRSNPLIGKRIGPYHVKSVIASGGMGTVYEAMQDQPRRVVALKVMHRNVASRSALRRFQFESQVLARLRHRNIAQVFAAGMHDDGDGGRVPYFAMEYIPGAKSITRYADDKELGTRERLGLFAKVCDAVHLGHQKGIIHRDLKPANLLVDSAGEPKVIDFGVARATDSDLAITTQQTNIGQLIGTMQYMSPEQCDADPHDLDTRSDVYALGVVLYELLTGQLPYAASRTTIYQATMTIKERAPRRPSSINPKLRGDLETIVLKALEKDRDRRYQSAVGLALDIRRFLAGQPIAARPPSFGYLASKFVRRHKWQSAALGAGVLAAVALVVMVFVWSFWQEADDAREHEVRARSVAVAAQGEERKQRQRAEIAQYGAKLGAAEAALNMNDAATARQILRQAREQGQSPAPDGSSMPWEWRHLSSRVDQSLRTVLDLPGSSISDMAVSLDGRRLVVCRCVDKEFFTTLCDLEDDSEFRLDEPGEISSYAAFSADGTLLATATIAEGETLARTIRLWKVDARTDPVLLTQWRAGDIAVGSLAFHPVRPVLASGDADGAVRLWNLSDLDKLAATDRPRPLGTWTGHAREIVSLAFSPDGTLLASGSVDHTARLWELDDQALADPSYTGVVLVGHDDHVLSVAFNPDGTRLATASVDRTIRLWDVRASVDQARGVPAGILTGHTEAVTSVAFDSTGTRLVSGSGDATVRVWDVDERATVSDTTRRTDWRVPRRRLVNTLRGHAGRVWRVAFLPDGRIVSAADDGAVKLWAADVEDVWRLPEHFSAVDAVAFSPDGRFAISAGGDCCFIVWDVAKCVPVARRILRDNEMIRDLACWQVGDRALLATATDFIHDDSPFGGRLLIWDLDGLIAGGNGPAKPLRELSPGDVGRHQYLSIAVSEDGRRLAGGTLDGRAFVWDITDLAQASLIARLEGHTATINALVFLDEHGRWLATCSGELDGDPVADHSIRLWDSSSGKMIAERDEHRDTVRDLALSPDRHTLASASYDKTIRLWHVDRDGDVPSLEPGDVPVLTGHTDWVYALAFHPIEHRLASGSRDRTIKLWDYETGIEVAALRGQAGPVRDLAFDPAGARLASASEGFQGSDNVARLWETWDSTGDGRRADALSERARLRRAQRAVWNVFRTAVDSPEEAKQRIKESDSLPEDVRDAALKRFEAFLPYPEWFHLRIERIVTDPGRDAAEYEKALRWAELAAKLAPESGKYQVDIAALQYRLGRYNAAIETVDSSMAVQTYYQPAALAVAAMAHHVLGHDEEAEESLNEAGSRMANKTMAGLAINQTFVKEAAGLLKRPR